MPIYGYKCSQCKHQQDHLVKMNQEVECCPKCHSKEYVKTLSAAGFVLKGQGYYATDFKNSESKSKGEGCGGGCACHPTGS